MVVVVTINLLGAGKRLHSYKMIFQANYCAYTGVYGEAEFIFA